MYNKFIKEERKGEGEAEGECFGEEAEVEGR